MKNTFLPVFGAILTMILMVLSIGLLSFSSLKREELTFQNTVHIGIFLSSLFIWIYCRKSIPGALKRVQLLCVLLTLPTLRSHSSVQCDTDAVGYVPIGEVEYKSSTKYLSIKPFFNSFVHIFTHKTCESGPSGYFSENELNFNIISRLSNSNMYFIHFFSVLFNLGLIVLFIRRR